MKNRGKFIQVLFATLLSLQVAAQDNDCIYRQTYPADKATTLKVFSKYGDINIVTVEDDSISVCATITIKHDNPAVAKSSAGLISVRFEKKADTITCETIYDKKFFNAAYSNGRRSFSVDYLISVPQYINASLRNELGNISIDEMSGYLNVRLVHGMINIKKLTRDNTKPVNFISAIQGTVEINEANWLSLNLNHCQKVVIDKGVAVLVNSEFSKISAGEISSMVSDSKSDSYTIESIKNLVSKSTYSTYILEKMSGQVQSSLMFGSIGIENTGKEFKLIDISSDKGIVKIVTGEEVSFSSDISVFGTLIDFTDEEFPGITKSNDGLYTKLTGSTGKDKETQSTIKVRAKSGKFTIQR